MDNFKLPESNRMKIVKDFNLTDQLALQRLLAIEPELTKLLKERKLRKDAVKMKRRIMTGIVILGMIAIVIYARISSIIGTL